MMGQKFTLLLGFFGAYNRSKEIGGTRVTKKQAVEELTSNRV